MAYVADAIEAWKRFQERFYDPRNRFLERTRIREDDPPMNYLKLYIQQKHQEGCSLETLRTYFAINRNFLYWNGSRPLDKVTSRDVMDYLNDYQTTNGCGNRALDDIRRAIHTFFDWMVLEDYIASNPLKKVKKIKYEHTIEVPFTADEMERIRDACANIRELALIDTLYSTGVRVSELCRIDIPDVDFVEGEIKVMGKGSKERFVYLDTRAKLHLRSYLEKRMDSNVALFVRAQAPYVRMEKSGVEYLVKDIGARANVENCHPHRFRRTLATHLLNRGMPIEQVQKILGHTKLDTTLIYANVNQAAVKMNHAKYI